MTSLYPLRFTPLFRRYLWGGRRLETLLGKSLGEGEDYAESWEIVDHGPDQSVVAEGPLRGTTLHELVTGRGSEILGRHAPQRQFPLLLKFLDAHRNLSVQVHPNDEQAARLDPPDLGKTEAWVVLHAEPESVIYAGLKRGFDRAAFERELARGTGELCLHQVHPRPGDCLFIPAGTVHALGRGLVVAEIQQASDTTFRLYDWNRLGPDGRPRPLHLEEGLAVTDFDRGPIQPQPPQPTADSGCKRLVECDKFVLDRWHKAEPWTVGGDNGCHVLVVLEGELQGEHANWASPLRRGECLLVPASCGPLPVAPNSDSVTVLDSYLP